MVVGTMVITVGVVDVVVAAVAAMIVVKVMVVEMMVVIKTVVLIVGVELILMGGRGGGSFNSVSRASYKYNTTADSIRRCRTLLSADSVVKRANILQDQAVNR